MGSDRGATRATAAHTAAPHVDAARLRAGLRLVFLGDTADRLARLARPASDPAEALDAVVPAATLRYTLAQWRQRLRRGTAPERAVPLAPATGLPGHAALALALHVALDLDTAVLSRLFGRTPEQVGLDLAHARGALRPSILSACLDSLPSIGRYRDAALDLGERVALYQHARGCDRCRAALEAAEAADADLRALLDAVGATLPPEATRRGGPARALATPTALLASGGALLVVLLLVAGLIANRFLAAPHVPVPLRPAAQPADATGWLLFERSDGIAALDLASGTTRLLVPDPYGGRGLALVSPAYRRVAYWSPWDVTPGNEVLEVYDLDGRLLHSWSWEEDARPTYPTAWLDEETLLVVQQPQWDPTISDQENQARWRRETALVAIDVASGARRVLLRGSVGWAVPSPDGTLIAISGSYESDSRGTALDVRPLGPDGLGPPIASITRVAASAGVWVPDGSRVYLGIVAGPGIEPKPADPVPGQSEMPARIDLVALDRDGRVTTIVEGRSGVMLRPITFTPDGQTLIFQSTNLDGPETFNATLWQVPATGGTPTPLATGSYYDAAYWRDGSEAILLVNATDAFPQGEIEQFRPGGPSPAWWTISVLGPDGTRRPVVGLPWDAAGWPIAWLPPDALPAPAETPASEPLRGEVSPPERVTGMPAEYTLDARSTVSPDGRVVVVADKTSTAPVIWDREREESRARFGAADFAWVRNGSDLLIGVAVPSEEERLPPPGRLTFYTGNAGVGFGSLNYRGFDPAGIYGRTSERYARPLVAPGGRAMSFFTVDVRAGETRLWVATWDNARIVDRWPSHAGALGNLPTLALWAGPDTLLYAVPEAMRDGFPQQVTLRRAVVAQDGGVSTESLVTLRAGGGERGIVLREMALSPDGSHVALRLRHYTRRDPARGAYDTVRVLPADDLTQQVEVARGNPGDGLSWAPDSHWLSFGLRGRVALATHDGRSLRYLSPEDTPAAYPLWVGPGEVWFVQGEGNVSHIVRVTVR